MNAYLKRKTTLREKKQKVTHVMVSTTFRLSLVGFIVVFGALYIWQTNTVSTKGYAISELEQQIKQLEHENRRLDVRIAEYSSMKSIEQRLGQISLVPADSVEYVSIAGTAVAKR